MNREVADLEENLTETRRIFQRTLNLQDDVGILCRHIQYRFGKSGIGAMVGFELRDTIKKRLNYFMNAVQEVSNRTRMKEKRY